MYYALYKFTTYLLTYLPVTLIDLQNISDIKSVLRVCAAVDR